MSRAGGSGFDPKTITPGFAVSAQIDAADIPAIAGRGFRSVICNRPDGEDAGQPAFAEIAAAARAAGIDARHVPIRGGVASAADLAAFDAALRDLPHPVLAYCRSGTRSANLWSLHAARADGSH